MRRSRKSGRSLVPASISLAAEETMPMEHIALSGVAIKDPLFSASFAELFIRGPQLTFLGAPTTPPLRPSPPSLCTLFESVARLVHFEMAVNASFVSPTADAKVAHVIQQFDTSGLLSTALNGFTVWKLILTLLITAVAYDQCMTLFSPFMLALDNADRPTVKYIWNKGSIVGPAWKAPFIGPFLDSVNPDFTKYHAKWSSGPLSCVSVFHKYGSHITL